MNDRNGFTDAQATDGVGTKTAIETAGAVSRRGQLDLAG